MVLVQHLANVGDVEVVLGLVAPGQLDKPLQIGANDAGLGRLSALVLQALQFTQRALQHLRRHAGGLDLVTQAIGAVIVLVAQLLANGLHLLAQHVVALRLLRAVAGILLNLAADVGDADFLAEVLQHHLQARPAVKIHQQRRLGFERQADQSGDGISQRTGRSGGARHGHDLLIGFAHQLDVLLQVGDGLQLEGFIDGVFFGQLFVAADQERAARLHAQHPHAPVQLDQHLNANRRAQHVARRGHNSDREDVIDAGRFHLSIALHDDQQVAALFDGRLHSGQGGPPADGYGRRDSRKNRAPAQWHDGDGFGFVIVAHRVTHKVVLNTDSLLGHHQVEW